MFFNEADIIKSHSSSHAVTANRGPMDNNIIVPFLVTFIPINNTVLLTNTQLTPAPQGRMLKKFFFFWVSSFTHGNYLFNQT